MVLEGTGVPSLVFSLQVWTYSAHIDTMSARSVASFARLPRGLRDEIYRYALASDISGVYIERSGEGELPLYLSLHLEWRLNRRMNRPVGKELPSSLLIPSESGPEPRVMGRDHCPAGLRVFTPHVDVAAEATECLLQCRIFRVDLTLLKGFLQRGNVGGI